MPGRSRKSKRQLPKLARDEHERLRRALLDTFEKLWKGRSKEEGNTQAATMQRAGYSAQQWGNWNRGDDDMTLTAVVAVAFALDRRIDFDLSGMSDPSDRVPVVTNDEGIQVSDDVLNLAEEIDKLPEKQKDRIMGAIEGMLTVAKTQRIPSAPDADQRGHGVRTSSSK